MRRDATTADESTGQPASLAPGALVGSRYRIVTAIGSGGMGHVYRAVDLELGREVALKTLHAVSPDAMRRFRREVALAVRITHPNVVRLHDLGNAGPVPFLTMDLIDGPSLARRLEAGTLPLAEAIGIAGQIAEGLAAAHEVGVVHRDLKPGNILLAADGRAVVVDFGVASEAADGQVAASAIVGTSAYMAPEQANGEAATPRADLYALGLVLFEMLSGEVPLVGKGPLDTAMRRTHEQPPSLRSRRSEVPAELDALIHRLLARDPAARPSSAGEVAQALKQLPLRPVRARSIRPIVFVAVTALAAAGAYAWVAKRPVPTPARISIDSISQAELPPSLAFLRPKVPWAAFRALAGQRPNRVTAPGESSDGTLIVRSSLALRDERFFATLQTASREFHGQAATPAAAFDQAAGELVRSLYPDGWKPLPSDEADRVAWGAHSNDQVLAIRRAEIAHARFHDQEAVALVEPVRKQGFVRPYFVWLYSQPTSPSALEETVAQLRGSPPREQAIFAAAGAALNGDGLGTLEKLPPHDQADIWNQLLRAWGLAYLGRLDDAMKVGEELGTFPELKGMSLRLIARLLGDFDLLRFREAIRRLSDGLAEEPEVWVTVGQALISYDDLDGASTALDHARALGGDGDSLAVLEGELGLARLDPESVRRAGTRLVASSRLFNYGPARVRGLAYLYLSDVLAGDFVAAGKRATELLALFAEDQTRNVIRRGDRLGLAQDALIRGDRVLARQFAESEASFSKLLQHPQGITKSAAFLLALDRIENRITDASFRTRLDRLVAEASRHSLGAHVGWTAEAARLLVALARNDCSDIPGAAPSYLTDSASLATMETARCEIAAGDAAMALTRLQTPASGIWKLPNAALSVRHELILGEALAAVGRKDEARPHLQRVVNLWGRTHRPEPVLARELLAK